jgi:hypothetical protein
MMTRYEVSYKTSLYDLYDLYDLSSFAQAFFRDARWKAPTPKTPSNAIEVIANGEISGTGVVITLPLVERCATRRHVDFEIAPAAD